MMSALYRGMVWEAVSLKRENPQTSSVSGQNCLEASATQPDVSTKKKLLKLAFL